MTAAAGHPNLVHARDVDAEEMDAGDTRCARRSSREDEEDKAA